MWKKNSVFLEDLESVLTNPSVRWEKLAGKNILVTGATGLIGYTVCSAILYANQTKGMNIHLFALVRDIERAKKKFAEQLADGCDLNFVLGDVEHLPHITEPLHYILHAAGPTASRFFGEKPVETISEIVIGTENILSLAYDNSVQGVVFLSTLEVFGQVSMSDNVLKESDLGYVDLQLPRSSYPEAKRLAELLCNAYYHEYGLPVRICRLTQTFGAGVDPQDARVFAYMARCALAGEDIVLKTAGKKKNMYLYTADAAAAILMLLTEGEGGAVYNTANPDTYCSVREMGELVARVLGNGKCSLITNDMENDKALFRPDGCLNLDTSSIEALGWRPTVDLEHMYLRMVAAYSS